MSEPDEKTIKAKAAVTRFAPSPTGLLHIGHAFSALVAAEEAKRGDGRMLLRIEDIDGARCRAEFEDAIYQDLEWLGLTWENPVRRQSEHMDDYRRALSTLEGMGVLYPCFCTRADIRAEIERSGEAPQDDTGSPSLGPVYPGTCRGMNEASRRTRLQSGKSYAMRLDLYRAMGIVEGAARGRLEWREFPYQTPADSGGEGKRGQPRIVTCDPTALGDVVLARKDVPTSYHLAVTLDDHTQGVTCVTRGQDLAPATHIHRILQSLLGFEVPDYVHHELIKDEDGKRLAKRADSKSLRAMREAGVSAANVRRLLGFPA